MKGVGSIFNKHATHIGKALNIISYHLLKFKEIQKVLHPCLFMPLVPNVPLASYLLGCPSAVEYYLLAYFLDWLVG